MFMTPLQKSIAEIEAKISIKVHSKEGYSYIDGLRTALYILTANLEYEREEFEKAYNQGHDDACDGNAGQRKEFISAHDYYTKTYEHDNRL